MDDYNLSSQPEQSSNQSGATDLWQRLEGQIKLGRMDRYLDHITRAVADRQKQRKVDVMAQVHEVFGPNADVTMPRTGMAQQSVSGHKESTGGPTYRG